MRNVTSRFCLGLKRGLFQNDLTPRTRDIPFEILVNDTQVSHLTQRYLRNFHSMLIKTSTISFKLEQGTKNHSLRKHPFLLTLRRWGRFEERGETDVFAG